MLKPNLKTKNNRLHNKALYGLTSLLFFSLSAYGASCKINANPVNFGAYDVFSSAPLDAASTIKVNCSPGNTSYTIALESGLNGPINNRRLRSATSNDYLNYNLYIDTSRTIIWGDGTGNSQTVTSNKNQPTTVYGRIPANQNVSIGSYSDSVTIRVDF